MIWQHHHLPTVSSTNRWAIEWLRQHNPQGPVLFTTDHQTEGRGQRNRRWNSEAGRDVCLSLAFPAKPGWQPANINMRVALAVREAMLEHLPASQSTQAVLVKWPNDILVGKRKIAGILCEVISSTYAVVGIGVNLTSIPGDLAEENVCSLKDFGLGLHEEIAPLLGHLVRLLSNRWSDASTLVESQTWEQFFSTRLGTLGRKIQITLDDGSSWSGLASGLDSMGRLLVIPEGETIARALSSGDVRHLRA